MKNDTLNATLVLIDLEIKSNVNFRPKLNKQSKVHEKANSTTQLITSGPDSGYSVLNWNTPEAQDKHNAMLSSWNAVRHDGNKLRKARKDLLNVMSVVHEYIG